jgi:hypothetical protein
MTVVTRAVCLAVSGLFVATLADAQPKPQDQPPLPRDPLPAPAPNPRGIEKPQPEPRTPAPGIQLGRSELVLSGCLQLAQEGRAGSASAAPAGSPIAAGYVLRHALPVSKDGTRETSGSRGKDYRIVASHERVSLADVVGHQVKVVGVVKLEDERPGRAATESSRSTSQPSGSTGVSSAPAGTSGPTPLVTLTVSKVESIAPSCTTPAS